MDDAKTERYRYDHLRVRYSNAQTELGEFIESKYKSVWQRSFFKLKIKRCLANLMSDVILYGTALDLNEINRIYDEKTPQDYILKSKIESKKRKKELLIEDKISWYQINPHSKFKRGWSTLISILLMYAITIMPWRLAFTEPIYFDGWTILETCIDFIFLLDVIVNILSCEIDDLGIINTKFSSNLMRYTFSWFLLDLTASIPLVFFDYYFFNSKSNAQSYNTLMKLAKIPKLVKLTRIAKVMKAYHLYKQSGILEKLQDNLQINTRVLKILKFFATLCISIHIMGCLWFYAAKLYNFDNTTWVFRFGYLDKSSLTQYLAAAYFSFYTIVTVGYGDIYPGNYFEVILAMVWIMIGVCIYSFGLGSLSTVISGVTTKEGVLSSKFAAIHEFAKESGISDECKQKIRSAVRYNIYSGSVWNDQHALFHDIPKSLKYEVAMSMHNGIVHKIGFFKDKDQSFIISVMPMMKPMQANDGNYLFKEDTYADEMYFIIKGRVNLVLSKNEIVYKSFLKGSYIGEIEILLPMCRISNSQACGLSEFLTINKRDICEVLKEFPDVSYEMTSIANERMNRIKSCKKQMQYLIDINSKKGTLKHLSGKENIFEDEEDQLYLDEKTKIRNVINTVENQKEMAVNLSKEVERVESLCMDLFKIIIDVAEEAQTETAQGVGELKSKTNPRLKLPKLNLDLISNNYN